VRNRDQPAEHGVGAVRQRNAGAHPARRYVEYVVPQVVDGARPCARAPGGKVFGLMAEPQSEEVEEAGPGTQPASLDDLEFDSVATIRPMATQDVFRPHFDDDSEGMSVDTGDTEPQDHTTATRALSPMRRLG